MRTAIAVRKEYKKACEELKTLTKKNNSASRPRPEDEDLYFRLHAIKDTLEWVHPALIKTESKERAQRNMELIGHKHYVFGPVFATFYP
jgi:hypothetical protein